VNPLVPAAALTGCYLVGLAGWRLVGDPGPAHRFDDGGARPDDDVERKSLITRLIDRLSSRLAPMSVGLMSERRRAKTRTLLDSAGRPLSLEGFAGRRATHAALFTAGGLLFLVQGNWVAAMLLVIYGLSWMDIWLSGAARRRQAQIERDLPDFLDILAVTVAAGVGFRPALARVSEALEGPLGEEVTLALRQMDLGASRRDAFEGLRVRNQSESLGSFVTSLLQAEELGVPLADALTDLADDMRRSFQQKARRRASRAAPRVSLITTTIIVPGAMILIVVGLFIGSGISLGELVG
jgi:tight adherence protein C